MVVAGGDGPLGCQVVDPGGGGGWVWRRGGYYDEFGHADFGEVGEVGGGAVAEGYGDG